jgi:ribosomal protein L14E/L6E/L27E
MAISGHKTLTEVQRYTVEADRKILADRGMAKKRRGQSENADVTNMAPPLHKHGAKSLNQKD